MKRSLGLALLGLFVHGLGSAFSAPLTPDDVGAAQKLTMPVGGGGSSTADFTYHMLPSSGILPTCRPRTDVCDIPSYIAQCIPGTGNVFVGEAKFKFCNFQFKNILKDPKHCSACNIACPAAFPYCVSGICRATEPVTVDLRIEGNDAEGTLFEGKVATNGRVLTSASGEAGHCDATFWNENLPMRGTITTAMDDAARLNGFNWDGEFYESFTFYDFFVRRISASAETGTQRWQAMRNGSTIGTGNCMVPVTSADSLLWAYGDFQAGALLLQLTGPGMAQKGQSVVYTVTGMNPQTKAVTPVAGAKVRGQLTDANGKVTVAYNQQCIYHIKAEKAGNIRSNAVWTLVL